MTSKLRIKKIKVDNTNLAVKAYENAVMEGVSELNDEQRKILNKSIQETNISDREIKKLFKKNSFFSYLIHTIRSALLLN
jgi:hypothetical protein